MKPVTIAEIRLSDKEIQAAVNILRSGNLRQGKECEAFEKEFSEKVGTRYAVATANGTAALHLAYLSFLNPHEEVLVPSFTFIATGSMAAMVGAKPVFCDVDPGTFLIDLDDAAVRVTEKTKAIAPVHLYGNPCGVEKITAFAQQHHLKIVWDAAQAHGATFRGQDIGSLDDFVCYSFYPSKNMFVGEGGMICTNNSEYDHKLRYLRTHGQTGKYYHTMLGLNYRMTDVEAAIGREQLKRLDQMLEIRRRNATLLNSGLSRVPGILLQKITPGSQHAWHQYCVVVDEGTFGCNRDRLGERLRECGIASGVHYPRGLHQQPVFEQMYGKTHLPNTEYLSDNILALPIHHGLSEDDIRRIIAAIQSCAG